MSASEINQLCGVCHRKPAAAGDSTDWSNPWNTRHQPLYLAESACFRKSGGKLNCVTCHAPHAPLERTAAAYNQVCSGCHARPRHGSIAAAAARNCVGCHMPAVKPNPYLAFANHWIGVYAKTNPLRPVK